MCIINMHSVWIFAKLNIHINIYMNIFACNDLNIRIDRIDRKSILL